MLFPCSYTLYIKAQVGRQFPCCCTLCAKKYKLFLASPLLHLIYLKLLLSGKNKQKALYLFIHRYSSRFTHPGAWFSVSNRKYYKMHLF